MDAMTPNLYHATTASQMTASQRNELNDQSIRDEKIARKEIADTLLEVSSYIFELVSDCPNATDGEYKEFMDKLLMVNNKVANLSFSNLVVYDASYEPRALSKALPVHKRTIEATRELNEDERHQCYTRKFVLCKKCKCPIKNTAYAKKQHEERAICRFQEVKLKKIADKGSLNVDGDFKYFSEYAEYCGKYYLAVKSDATFGDSHIITEDYKTYMATRCQAIYRGNMERHSPTTPLINQDI